MSLFLGADGSAIDEWDTTYHASGTVRDADLAIRMRYRSEGPLRTILVPTP